MSYLYLEENFMRLEAQMDVVFANISRRISQLEDIVRANIAQRSRMVAADGEEGVSDPSMGLLTDASEQLGKASDMGEDVGDDTAAAVTSRDRWACDFRVFCTASPCYQTQGKVLDSNFH